MSILRRFVDVDPEERRTTFAAFVALLAITTGHTLLETARDALFLAKLPAAQLPWMYLVIVVIALALAKIRRADSRRVIACVLVVGAALTALFWALTSDVGTRSPVLYALYVWSGLFASWIMIQLWTLLGRVHTVTQARRLYGFIGAGAVLGGVLGAFAARAALAFVAPRGMLLVSSALFAISAMPVLGVRVPPAPTEPAAVSVATDPSMSTGASLLWHNGFARRILGIAFVATVAVTLTDFLFKLRLAEAFPDAHELAARLSTFYAVVNTIALLAQLFIAPWVFRTVGVQRALFFFPLLLVGAAGGVIVTGGRLLSALFLKAMDGTLRYSVHKTSMELLLVPIPDGTRERVKPIIDLVGVRGGQALASVGILVLVALGAAQPAVLGALVVGLGVLWLSIVVTIRRHYLDVFRETLRSGGLSGDVELPELDLSTLEMLITGLNSARDQDVLASLELLAEQKRQRLIPALILFHPSRDVVLRALALFTERGNADFVSIADRLNSHMDREVAAAALRARTAVAPDRELLDKRLADPCPQVSATALVALIARGWIDPEEAGRRVGASIGRRSWQTAAELARAIRDVASGPRTKNADSRESSAIAEQLDDLLIKLAREAGSFRDLSCAVDAADLGAADPKMAIEQRAGVWGAPPAPTEIRVRLEVARAMAARRSPKFLPVLVGMLNRHELRATARAAIAEIPGALEFLDEVMGQYDLARNIRVHLPRTMALLDASAAAPKLMVHLQSERDGAVRFKVLRGLIKLRRADRALALEQPRLMEVVESTLERTGELRSWGAALGRIDVDNDEAPVSRVGPDPMRAAHHLLTDLVRDKERHAIQRIFMLLELLYGEDFEAIERGLRSKRPKTRASSLELVENIVRSPLRARVVALVAERAPELEDVPSYEEAVLAILAKGGTTLGTLAEYRALELGLDATAVTGTRPAAPETIESIGLRLVDRARDLLTAESESALDVGASRAPA